MWRKIRMSNERAWFLKEEGEERIEHEFLAEEFVRDFEPHLPSLVRGKPRQAPIP